MYRYVCLLVFLFLNFGFILGEPQTENVKDCTAAERELCEDNHGTWDTCCQDLRKLIRLLKDSRKTWKTRDNNFEYYTFHVLSSVIGFIGEFIFRLFLILKPIFALALMIFLLSFYP